MSRLEKGTIWVLLVGAISVTSSASRSIATDSVPGGSAAEATVDALGAARQLLKDGKYAEAEAAARVALESVEQVHGTQSLEATRALDVLVESLWRGGKATVPESRALAERVVETKEAALGADHPDVALSLNSLANLLRLAGDYAGARPLFERALAIREQALGPDHPEVAASLGNLAILLRDMGDYASALPVYERALAISEQAFGANHPDVALSLNNLAALFFDTADYARAWPLLERTLAIWEEAHGPDHPHVALSLNNLANVLLKTGDYARARPLYERALAIRRKALGPDHPDVATSLTNLAVLLRITGDYADAQPLYERALAIRERASGATHPTVATSLNNLAALRYTTGDYVGARLLFERSLAIRETTLGADHPGIASSLNNLATLLRDVGDYAGAQLLFERALAIRERALKPDHPNVAGSVNSLAILLRVKGDYAGARPLFERALAILEKALGPDHPDVALSLNSLASLLHDTGDHADALPLYERALAILEKALGPDHPDVATCLGTFASLLRAKGDYSGARAMDERALAIRERTLALDHPDVGEAHSALAMACLLDRDLSAGLDHALQAELVSRKHFRVTVRGLSESEASRYSAIRVRGLDVALAVAAESALPTDAWRVWDSEVHSRAVLLDEMAARHRVLRESGDPAVDSLFTVVGRARARLANLTVRGVGELEVEVYRKLLDEARKEADESERALAEKSASFHAQRARTEIGLSEVLNALSTGAALVAYCRYEEPVPGGADSTVARYLAFVAPAVSENSVDGSGDQREVSVVPLGAAAAIDSLVAQWRDAVSGPEAARKRDSEAAYRISATRLREAIWDPVVTKIGECSTVFVVPDGPLHLVSLATLPTGEGGYVVEEGPVIHYLSAERDLVPEDNTPGSGLLVVGDPNYESVANTAAGELFARVGLYRGEPSRCEEFETLRFERLPGTEKEAKAIGSLWKRLAPDGQMITSCTGPLASEARIKEEVSGKRVVHLATHGFFVGEGCPSVVATTRGLKVSSSVEDPPPVPKGENPLRLSGLALAGANRREDVKADEEDGILTAEEVAALDLTGVEWAVLSACGTGVGEVRSGEGVFGLRRAFETAGAGTLITSLWSVQDETARAWMERLYHERLEMRRTTAEAVREASRAMLEERRRRGLSTHPFSWGAFIGAGEWR